MQKLNQFTGDRFQDDAHNEFSKRAIASKTLWGGLLLSALSVAEILTGDPFSLNGAIKFSILILGGNLVLWGRLLAYKRIDKL